MAVSSKAPGMAKAEARRAQMVKAARHEKEHLPYHAARTGRLLWRNRWVAVPGIVAVAAWGVVGGEVVRHRMGGAPPTGAAWTLAIVVTVLGVGWAVRARFFRWDHRRRRAWELGFAHRWEDTCRDLGVMSAHGRVYSHGKRPPRVRRQRRHVPRTERQRAVVLSDGGTMHATVNLPLRVEESALLTTEGTLRPTLARSLYLPKLGTPEWTQVWRREVNGAAWWNVRCAYRRPPTELHGWGFRPAPDDFTLRAGSGPDGENLVDLLASPHLRVYGPPRSGKGVVGMDSAAQGVMRGWLILLINCSGAPEWNPWGDERLPNVKVIRCSLRDPIPGAVEIARGMGDLLNVAEARDRVCTTHHVHSWAQLDDATRLLHPRVLCVIDEPSALLKTAGKVGKTAGGMIEMAARTGPKYGITLMTLDQIINVTASAISGPTLEVMRYMIWMGDQPDAATRIRIGGFVAWPTQPTGKGGGVAMNFGAPASARQVRMPYHSPAQLDQFLNQQAGAWADHLGVKP